MKNYLYINKECNNFLGAIFQEEDPIFPGIPIEDRVEKSMLDGCVIRTDEEMEAQGIQVGMTYDPETDTFFYPEPEPATEPEPEDPDAYTITSDEAAEAYVGGVNNVE